MPTHRNFYMSPGDKITATDAVEITLIRFVGAGMAEVELRSDGDIEIEEHDPIREAVADEVS